MGVGLLETGVKMRKFVICTIRGCFRLVCSHPFLVGLLCFLIFLHRSFPFVFSLFVSASPILVCTAVLLGTLLSFGQPNLPEIEKEEKTTNGVASLKTGLAGNSTVVERSENYSVERYDEKRSDLAEKLTAELGLEAGKTSEVDGRDSLDDTMPLIEERSREIKWESKIIEEAQRESAGSRHEQERELKEEQLDNEILSKNQYSPIPNDEHLESDDDKSQADSFDSERVNVDSLDSPPRSPWKRMEEMEEEEKEEGGTLDPESDKAESSSPDASMTDIIPMLDELHPLLDEDVPHPVHLSRDGSDAASEHSPKSSTGSHESDDETENHTDLKVADDENEDAEDEEDTLGDKEEQMKSAIMWTEEDQKNLMELGSSELERNQRLENLIARRRARKNMSMLPERNLIDLESVDLPFNIAPISTRRHNPFDLPHNNSGLPPIPGSAPSILLPRRNPFDIPYDSSEEKPDLIGDDFREDFMTFQPKEPVFRRHESFNVGPSIFAPNRQEKRDIKLRPYFVPEGMISEESSFSHFQRQSSELSDSKVSSVPETESIGSVGDLEDRKLAEEDISEEPDVISKTEVIEEVISRETELISEMEDNVEEDIPREPEPISKIEDVSKYVGHGSQSSEDVESLELGQIEKRDADVDELDFQLRDMENRYEEGNVAGSEEVLATEFHSSVKAGEQRYSIGSGSSSSSELSERIFNEKEGDSLSTLEERRDAFPEGRDISSHPSVESGDLNITVASVDDNPFKDPVYDSSPQAFRRNLSLSSTSSDVHVESEPGLLTELVKKTDSVIERESEGRSREMEDSSNTIEMVTEFSKLRPVDKNESGTKNLVDIRENDIMDSECSGVDQIHAESPPEASTEEIILYQHSSYQHAQGEVSSSSFNEDIHVIVDPVAEQTFKSSVEKNLVQSEEEKHSLISEEAPVIQFSTPPFTIQLQDENLIHEEEDVRSVQDQVKSSDSDVNFDVGFHHEVEEKLISSHYSEEKSISRSDDELAFTDKPMNEPPFNHCNEVQEAPNTMFESIPRTNDRLNIPDVKKLDSEVLSDLNSTSRPEFILIPLDDENKTPASLSNSNMFTRGEVGNGDPISKLDIPAEAIRSHVGEYIMVETTDEIKEIDGLLSELDTVGDFNVNKCQPCLDKFEKHVDSYEESLSSPHEATNAIELVGSSNGGFAGRDTQDSTDLKEIEHNLNSKENNSCMHIVETRAVEIESIFKEYKLKSVETDVVDVESVILHRDLVDVDADTVMPELEAQTLQDISLEFKKISEREIENPIDVEPPHAELVMEETKVEAPVLEVLSTKDSISVPSQVHDSIVKTHTPPDSVHDALHELESIDIQGRPSELHAVEPIPSEDVNLVPKKVDGNLDKILKLNSEDGLAEVRACDVSLSNQDAESSIKEDGVKEVSTFSAEEPDREVGTPKDTSSTTFLTDKRKNPQKLSSSSSSCSDSSSSDSERE
ncbi:uncharacterized protein LOC111369332 [Olea europaea var. sylvestris]|uniref:uncharacterized protein LOC111369332 n=1 Tax=Olea europaea var. sylvestris TaxID=158386 RepID=UPI000C1D6A67|nr:uncharacterized protein LOC111369332 [Olea europaea var. sylvestris]XP_022846588.1 uncharacterized protein LOC111369332 [Olea europaea var. sylvestris]